MKRLVLLAATGAYSGYFPIVSGTFGTIPAWLIAWFVVGKNPLLLIGATVLSIIVSVWSAGKAEEYLGHDSKKIVIDEWAGMFVSLLYLPYRLDVYIAAFFLFRFYDVIKPFPAAYCETLPGGLGVTMDDIVAGLYALFTCQGLVFAARALNWFGY